MRFLIPNHASALCQFFLLGQSTMWQITWHCDFHLHFLITKRKEHFFVHLPLTILYELVFPSPTFYECVSSLYSMLYSIFMYHMLSFVQFYVCFLMSPTLLFIIYMMFLYTFIYTYRNRYIYIFVIKPIKYFLLISLVSY